MEFLQEAFASRDLVLWGILLLLLLIFLKLLMSAGKGLFILLICIGGIALVAKLFPEFLEQVMELIRETWQGASDSDSPD